MTTLDWRRPYKRNLHTPQRGKERSVSFVPRPAPHDALERAIANQKRQIAWRKQLRERVLR